VAAFFIQIPFMMEFLVAFTFVLGYAAIALEHQIRINKAASALITGTICWTIFILYQPDKAAVTHQLMEHLGEVSGILFFLLGAMTIVELIDAHDGFYLITEKIKTQKAVKLLWLIGLITFFLSAVLDNLTTTIVVVSLLRKIIADREMRVYFVGLTVIAANAGGAWSPIGDVTTTMLWIGGQVTAKGIISEVFLASVICLLVPILFVSFQLKGKLLPAVPREKSLSASSAAERNMVFAIGLGALLFVPVFKTITHLPPFMAILFGLGCMWVLTELIHHKKDTADKDFRSVVYALRKIDTPSILFFLGILLSIAALESNGQLKQLAVWLTQTIGNETIIISSLGLLSAVVDNVPLVAAVQGMYTLAEYPTDGFFWSFLAYATGTGGSILIIGSAAGVAAMGMEKIDFFWYLKRIALLAFLGYVSGCTVYVLQYNLLN
jgi:Na+/H+ antiporter NhaD/arsenite permease-like protein